MAARRTTEVVVPIVIPRGRSAAERRLSAVAALHQPASRGVYDAILGPTCPECNGSWPCATARLLGMWPGESED